MDNASYYFFTGGGTVLTAIEQGSPYGSSRSSAIANRQDPKGPDTELVRFGISIPGPLLGTSTRSSRGGAREPLEAIRDDPQPAVDAAWEGGTGEMIGADAGSITTC
jgi:hypothetical protein